MPTRIVNLKEPLLLPPPARGERESVPCPKRLKSRDTGLTPGCLLRSSEIGVILLQNRSKW